MNEPTVAEIWTLMVKSMDDSGAFGYALGRAVVQAIESAHEELRANGYRVWYRAPDRYEIYPLPGR